MTGLELLGQIPETVPRLLFLVSACSFLLTLNNFVKNIYVSCLCVCGVCVCVHEQGHMCAHACGGPKAIHRNLFLVYLYYQFLTNPAACRSLIL